MSLADKQLFGDFANPVFVHAAEMECPRTANALSNGHGIPTVSTFEAVVEGASEVQLLLIDVLELRNPVEGLYAPRMVELGTIGRRAFGDVVLLLRRGSIVGRLGFIVRGGWILLKHNFLFVLLGWLLHKPKYAVVRRWGVVAS